MVHIPWYVILLMTVPQIFLIIKLGFNCIYRFPRATRGADENLDLISH